MTGVGIRRHSMPRRTPDLRQIQILYIDVCGVSKTRLPIALTRNLPRRTHVRVAITLWVESDEGRPVQPAELRGGEQARRHRVVCNRGHGFLQSCVEFRDTGRLASVTHPLNIIACT